MENKRAISFDLITDGDIEPCRELCNELMAFQKSKAVMAKEAFDQMNFDTRMKQSYGKALRSHVVVARDGGVPIGYVFSTVDEVSDPGAVVAPPWAPIREGEPVRGFNPDWLKPQLVGTLSNLYFKEEYRGLGLGKKLLQQSMDWFNGFDDVNVVLIHVSNGNDNALQFYLHNGFTFSHDVFGGFIQAVYRVKDAARAGLPE